MAPRKPLVALAVNRQRAHDDYDRRVRAHEAAAARRLVELRAGVDPSDLAYVHTYGEREPERDHFAISLTRLGVVVARHWTMDLERRYRTAYGKHPPSLWWAYAPSAGVEVRTDEPEGWAGWRPAPIDQLALPLGAA